MQVIIPPTPHTGFPGDRWAGIQTHRDRHTHHRSSEVTHIQSLRWYLPLALIILPWSIACSHSNTVCGWQVCQEVPAQAENENTNKLHHLQDMQCSPSHYLVIQTFAFMFYLDSQQQWGEEGCSVITAFIWRCKTSVNIGLHYFI